jgi:hypothetical protein
MSKTCKILFRHPNKEVRALPPKVLEWVDHKKEKHYFEPTILQGKVVYELPEPYARVLLSNQPERYFLLEPKRMLIKVKKDGLSFENKEVASILNSKRFADFSAEAQEEDKGKPAASDGEGDGEKPAAGADAAKGPKGGKAQEGNQPVPPANGPQGSPQGSGSL